MFTYSHANMTLGPSERVYYLGYSQGEEVQVYMWVYLGDVTDEKESSLKFLEKVKIASLQNARRQAQSLTAEKYLCHDCKITMHSPSSNVIY